MGYLQYTLSDLKTKGVEHALMRTPDARINSAFIVNRALEFLVNFKRWQWLRVVSTFDFTAFAITSLARASNVVTVTKNAHGLQVGEQVRISGAVSATFNGVFAIASVTTNTFTYAQTGSNASASTPGSYFTSFLALPTDFGILETIVPYQFLLLRFEQRDPQEVMRLRIIGGSDAFYIAWFLSNRPQTGVTGLPTRRIEMGPPPQSAQAQALQYTYLRLVPALSGDTDVPDIPLGFHDLLMQGCRAMALRTEQPTAPAAQAEWATFMDLLKAAADADDDVEPDNHGPLRGPAGDYLDGPIRYRPFQTITLP